MSNREHFAIYRMTRTMYFDLRRELSSKTYSATQKDVVDYINRTRGLRVEIIGIAVR